MFVCQPDFLFILFSSWQSSFYIFFLQLWQKNKLRSCFSKVCYFQSVMRDGWTIYNCKAQIYFASTLLPNALLNDVGKYPLSRSRIPAGDLKRVS